MPAGERSQGDIEKAAAVRDGLIDVLQESPATRIVAPAVIDSNHPAFMIGTEDGVYIVSVQKVSSAVVERFSDV